VDAGLIRWRGVDSGDMAVLMRRHAVGWTVAGFYNTERAPLRCSTPCGSPLPGVRKDIANAFSYRTQTLGPVAVVAGSVLRYAGASCSLTSSGLRC